MEARIPAAAVRIKVVSSCTLPKRRFSKDGDAIMFEICESASKLFSDYVFVFKENEGDATSSLTENAKCMERITYVTYGPEHEGSSRRNQYQLLKFSLSTVIIVM
jgi:hypothetical protein